MLLYSKSTCKWHMDGLYVRVDWLPYVSHAIESELRVFLFQMSKQRGLSMFSTFTSTNKSDLKLRFLVDDKKMV